MLRILSTCHFDILNRNHVIHTRPKVGLQHHLKKKFNNEKTGKFSFILDRIKPIWKYYEGINRETPRLEHLLLR